MNGLTKMQLVKLAFGADDLTGLGALGMGAGGVLGAGGYLASRALQPAQNALQQHLINTASGVTQGRYLDSITKTLSSPVAQRIGVPGMHLARQMLPGANPQLQYQLLQAISPAYGLYNSLARLRQGMGRVGRTGLILGGLGAGVYGLGRLMNWWR